MLCLLLAALAAALGAGARAHEPRPVCASDHAESCVAGEHDKFGYHFYVNGKEVAYEFVNGDYFALTCPPSTALDAPALPRFEPALRVREVRLARCAPPAAGSYAAALRALHVAGPGGAPGGYLFSLRFVGVSNFNASVLAGMPTLRNLSISSTIVAGADLVLLPAGLERLELINTRTGRVSDAVLARLPHLGELVVEDTESVEVEEAGNLSSLYIRSPATLVNSSLPDTLASLDLFSWAVRRPEPWRSCAGLDSLRVNGAAAEWLPDGWLAHCARLRTLVLDHADNLKTLAPSALRGATTLEEVRFTECALEALPAGLLDDAPALRVLVLSDNKLHTLPGELFRTSMSLSELDLHSNNLTGSALSALGTATALSVLRIGANPALDACPAARDAGHSAAPGSPLRHLRSLVELSVYYTATRRMCPDWRQLPRLERLDLVFTSITQLNYIDLQFHTAANISVTLTVPEISLSRQDYKDVAAAPAGPTLTLKLVWPTLLCDCQLYWAAAALRLPNTRLREDGASCIGGSVLSDVPLDELVCAAPGPCPAGCTCGTREDVARPGRLLRVDCAGAELRRVPRVDARAALRYTGAEPVAIDLRLAGNRIDRLAPEDLPSELAALDLRYNALGEIDAATVAALVSRAGRVLLAGNPLNCSCGAAAALATMRARPDVFRDWADARCSDGTPLYKAAPLPCDDRTGELRNVTASVPKDASEGISVGEEAALALGAAAVTALVLVLARAALRWRRRARLPSVLRLARPGAGEWEYDAFVSFAHADWAVVRELVERLEGGAAPLRLCVHYRDWVPGGWIPAQIAESVRASRRTVAVVTEAFMRSKWARAEFREAYAAALEDNEPRIVLVLLEDPARLRLDAELRAYVSGNTYVRWGDPWFWRKLRRALPAPSARPAAEEAPSPPPSPPSELPATPPRPLTEPPAKAPSLPPGPALLSEPRPLST